MKIKTLNKRLIVLISIGIVVILIWSGIWQLYFSGAISPEYRFRRIMHKVIPVVAKSKLYWEKINHKRPERVSSTKAQLCSNYLDGTNIVNIQVDNDIVWFDTNKGIFSYHKKANKWVFYNDYMKIDPQYITSFAVAKDVIWIGTEQGLYRLNKKTKEWTDLNSEIELPRGCIYSLAIDDENLWMATWIILWGGEEQEGKGITQYNTVTRKLTTYTIIEGLADNLVLWVTSDRDSIWAATDRIFWDCTQAVVNRFDKRRKEWEFYTDLGFLITNLNAIVEDDEYIWYGLSNGLRRYSKKRKINKWVLFSTRDTSGCNDVVALALDGDYLWLGTSRTGAVRYNKKDNRWETFTTQNGLLSNYVKAIAIDEDSVWLGTDNGVSRLNKSKLAN